MAAEVPLYGQRVQGNLSPEQCVSIRPENQLPIGQQISVDQIGQYQLVHQFGNGIFLAQKQIDFGSSAPELVVMHGIRGALGEEGEIEKQQAIRRAAIPRFLQGRGATVPTSFDVLQLYNQYQEPIGTYTITEYVGQTNLEQLIEQQGGKLSPEIVAKAVLEIGKTLAIAHNAGIIHRDIKPSNVQLRDGSPVFNWALLTDWETAYMIRHDITPEWAASFAWNIGSPGYMPPEQFINLVKRDRGETDEQYRAKIENAAVTMSPVIDTYAFGMTIFEMLGGTLPVYTDMAMQAVIEQRQLQPSLLLEEPHVRELDAICAAYPELRNVLLKATSMNRADRYLLVRDLLTDMLPFFQRVGYNIGDIQHYIDSLPR